MRRLVRFFRLPGYDRRALLEALFLLTIVRLMLAFTPFEVAARRLDAMGEPRAQTRVGPQSEYPEGRAEADAEVLLWAIRAAARVVPRATCLVQALGARVLLRRRGLESELHVGVARASTGDFEAHAWLERHGRIVLGDLPDIDRYSRIRTPWTGAS